MIEQLFLPPTNTAKTANNNDNSHHSKSNIPFNVVPTNIQTAFDYFDCIFPSTGFFEGNADEIFKFVDKAYRQKMLSCHPDQRSKHGLPEEEALRLSKEANSYREDIKSYWYKIQVSSN